MKQPDTALIIIDEQRGFMPASEGQRLWMYGFGELPVPEGEKTIEPLNYLARAALHSGLLIATTQDWHPHETAHFAPEGKTPNFTTTWPRHCVANTPGAELHPGLRIPSGTRQFIKGTERLLRGRDDLSYSGYYARDRLNRQRLPDWLQRSGIHEIILGGLALDYCVGRTALDLRQKLGLAVTVALDATRPVARRTGNDMLRQFRRTGITTDSSSHIVQNLRRAA